ncbi:MAG: hypothetical protein ACOVS5_11570 [Oligoflexus sp.]|jgi:hypothetical protein
MLRSILIAASILFSASLQATPQKKCSTKRDVDGQKIVSCRIYIQQEKVLDTITINAENGGINPDFAAYTVSGRVEVAGNSCQAQGLKAYLSKKTVAGQIQIVAGVKGWVEENRVCNLLFAPVYEYVALTVRDETQKLASAVIKNAEELGLNAELTSPCFAPVFCTKEYQPNVCTFQDKEYRGSNLCQAKAQAQKAACLQDIEWDGVDCRAESFDY